MTAMRDAWARKLVEQAEADSRIVLLDGDLGTSTKADAFAAAHPERFFQMGIAEQNLVGVAAGMASVGLVPWTSSFAVFFTHRAVDPVRMLLAQSKANVKIAAAYSGLLIGAVGKTHLDVEDIAIMRAMPDMVVLAPADTIELESMMDWANSYPGPVYLRLVRDEVADLFRPDYIFRPGVVHVMSDGQDAALISTGPETGRALQAARILAAEGKTVRVIHVPSIKPLDSAGLRAALGSIRQVFTAEEHSVHGGLGGLVAEIVTSAGMGVTVTRFGLEDVWGESADNDFLLKKHGLSAECVAQRIRQHLSARHAG